MYEFSTETRMALLERGMLLLQDISKDHESRLRKLERWVMYGSGAVGVLSLVLHFLENHKG